MRRPLVLLALGLAAVTSVASAQSAAHPWTVRTRAVVIAPDASSTPAGLDVKAAATVEVDISRRLNDYLSLELILATASHEVTAGATSLGSVTHVPPTLLLQFFPVQRGAVRPYVGAGGNLTLFVDKSADLAALDLTTSLGWAAQAGVDVEIAPRAVFNLDAKYVRIATDVRSGGVTAYELDINPFVLGVGLGYRF